MRKTDGKSGGFLLLGLVLLAVGVILLLMIPNPQGVMRALPYVCIGLGCGLFGHSMDGILISRAVKNSPDLKKRMDVEARDERNVMLVSCAKAKAFDGMLYLFGVLLLAFALMGVQTAAVLLLAAFYLLVLGLGVYYRVKLEKEL